MPSADTVVLDITLELQAGMLVYPGDAAPNIRQLTSRAAGDALTASTFTLGCHVGTHVDAPAHFLPHARTLSDFPVTAFLGPALVLDLRGSKTISHAELCAQVIPPAHHLLIRSDNSERLHYPVYDPDHVYVERDAADYLVSLKPLSIGFDYYSVDCGRSDRLPAHETFARHDLLVYVCLNLASANAGPHTFHGLPLNLRGVEGAPVRAILSRPAP